MIAIYDQARWNIQDVDYVYSAAGQKGIYYSHPKVGGVPLGFYENDEQCRYVLAQIAAAIERGDKLVLSQNKQDTDAKNDNTCPLCGATVIHVGGCAQCPDPACGWSACG